MARRHIGLIAVDQWLGGVIYTHNLISALSRLPEEERPRLTLFCRNTAEPFKAVAHLVDKVVIFRSTADKVFGKTRFAGAARWAAAAFSATVWKDSDPELAARVKREGVECVFPTADGYSSMLPNPIAWIPDLQHCVLPEVFSRPARAVRDSRFSTLLRSPNQNVVFSSQCALNDAIRVYGPPAAKTHILHFATVPAPEWFQDPAPVVAKYGLTTPYLILCNQFWIHKDHPTAFRAVAKLAREGTRVPLVCTGPTKDNRHPDYFRKLQAEIRELGLEDQVRILGVIPRTEQVCLIRAAKAVLQPSRFEGWSTVVEDARALAKPVIASDFPVHLEQDVPGSTFFRMSDPDDCARAIAELWNQPDKQGTSRAEHDARIQQFARDFLGIVGKVVGEPACKTPAVQVRTQSERKPLKILAVHNAYRQPGGEDVAFEQEIEMLKRAGENVIHYRRTNSEIDGYSGVGYMGLVKGTVWASDTRREFAALLRREKPDVVHVHNTFVLISPSIYSACAEAGIPVVQTLHNFRLLCPVATLFREGKACEECLDHSLLRSVKHGCYNQSRTATAVVASMLAYHRGRDTWNREIASFVALSEFARRKFVQGGLPADRISVKPNFVYPDPGARTGVGEYALFVGRLSPEKRVNTILDAWRHLRSSIPLVIMGEGPERAGLEKQAQGLNNVRFTGRMPREEVLAAMNRARFLIFPSDMCENFPVTLVESFACGTPVICSRIGAMQDIVADGSTGLHFTTGDGEDLARKVDWAWAHPDESRWMGERARQEYLTRYTAEKNYPALMEIYRRTVEAHQAARNNVPAKTNEPNLVNS
jgi:glycosyltransferase involved in cell wall biosynthesis